MLSKSQMYLYIISSLPDTQSVSIKYIHSSLCLRGVLLNQPVFKQTRSCKESCTLTQRVFSSQLRSWITAQHSSISLLHSHSITWSFLNFIYKPMNQWISSQEWFILKRNMMQLWCILIQHSLCYRHNWYQKSSDFFSTPNAQNGTNP